MKGKNGRMKTENGKKDKVKGNRVEQAGQDIYSYEEKKTCNGKNGSSTEENGTHRERHRQRQREAGTGAARQTM